MKTLSGIFQFIKERFPLQVLTFTTLSTVLASVKVSTNVFSIGDIFIAFVTTTLFIFHIRVIDERRDFVNDTEIHPNRPVQRGVVSIKTLLIISISGIFLSLIFTLLTNLTAFAIALVFTSFTTMAAFDFFIPNLFKSKPILYHIVNSPQMILLQLLIFSIFTSDIHMSTNMLLFMLLVYNNIFILELVRKIKAPENDTNDSYTTLVGMKKSIAFLIFLLITGFIIYFYLLKGLASYLALYYALGGLICLITIGVILLFYFKPKKILQKIMELWAVLFYVIMNILILLAR